MVIYTISSKTYLDTLHKCYKNIIVINKKPIGPLENCVRQIHENKLSPFKYPSPCEEWKPCFYVIHHPGDPQYFFTVDEIPELFSFLTENNYVIDTNITNMMTRLRHIDIKDLICFISF